MSGRIGPGLRYAPGLDGVRALAVLAVFAYHIGTTSATTVLPGGFLGVDVFFVLSGYLITSLLIVEVHQTGRISIRNFYARRARRLLPALFALLLAMAAVGVFWLPQQATRLRGDLLASLGYVTNWWLIDQNSSYFATAGDRPPLLTHLWSLAVEEQYYLIWPLILVGFAAMRTHRGLMLLLIAAGVAASTAAGILMFDPFSDPSRVYYGTDTRALAPLLGAFLAVAVKPWQHRRRLRWAPRLGLDVLGIVAVLALAAVAAAIQDTDDLLYRGGLLGIAALGGIVVVVAGHPGTTLGEMLAIQPLKWLGERSYAIYLWHWPVCLLTRPGMDVPVTGWANAALRVALALVLAEISYRLIEAPIRRHGFLAPFRRAKTGPQTTVELGQHPVRVATGQHAVRVPTGQHAVRVPTGDHAVRVPTGQHAVRVPTGDHAVRVPTGQHAVRVPTGEHAVRVPTGQYAIRQPTGRHPQHAATPLGAGAWRGSGADEPGVGSRVQGHARAKRAPEARAMARVRSIVLVVVMVAGASWFGVRLDTMARVPMAGGPLDLGPAATLGPLGNPNATVTSEPPRPIPTGATVAFFGDSQAMTLLLNQPADLEKYIKPVDATIEGCGILLGRMESRSGERRNLSGNCTNWRSTWDTRNKEHKPALSVIMLGAWDVFDVTLDNGRTLVFGTSAWDTNFSNALASAIETLRTDRTDVALALLPCYRPIEASAGFWPERGDDHRTRHVNEVLRATAKRYPQGVRTLEPPTAFCTDAIVANDTAYRWDGVHYYKKGAALYFATMLPQILAAPPPSPTPTPTPTPTGTPA